MGFGDYLRDRVDNWRAHPFQNLIGMAAGAAGGPLASEATRRLFGGYNNYALNHAYNTTNNLINDQLGIDTNQAMNRPLNGPLGQFDDQGNYGGAPSNGGRAEQDRQLGQALSGGGGGQNSGGPMGGGAGYAPPGGWNQVSMSGWNPNQASGSQAFGLLDFLGPNMNKPFDIPTTPSSGGHMSPETRREGSNVGPGIGNYGVSNFMVGGSPVIFGQGDPMSRYLHNQRMPGG